MAFTHVIIPFLNSAMLIQAWKHMFERHTSAAVSIASMHSSRSLTVRALPRKTKKQISRTNCLLYFFKSLTHATQSSNLHSEPNLFLKASVISLAAFWPAPIGTAPCLLDDATPFDDGGIHTDPDLLVLSQNFPPSLPSKCKDTVKLCWTRFRSPKSSLAASITASRRLRYSPRIHALVSKIPILL